MAEEPSQDRVRVPSRRGVVIEFPGFILNPGSALATFGGEQALAAALEERAHALKLRLRPDDPLSHSITGERQACNGLLLRISRPRNNPDAEPKVTLSARVDAVYTFSGLADYQYLPLDPHIDTRSFGLLPSRNQPAVAEPFRVPQPLLMAPPLFSRIDTPTPFAFQDISDQQRQELARAAASKRTVPWTAANLPTKQPLPDTVPGPLAAALQQLLEQHPVWPLPHLREQLQQLLEQQQQQDGAAGNGHNHADAAGGGEEEEGHDVEMEDAEQQQQQQQQEQQREGDQQPPGHYDEAHLQAALQATCYQFKTGPWKYCHIRCGFDPRRDASGRTYQLMSYRLPSEWQAYVKARREAGDPLPEPSVAAVHRFEAMPVQYTTMLQLGSVADATVETQLREAPTPNNCSESYGWFTYTIYVAIQQAITKRFAEVLEPLLPEAKQYVEQHQQMMAERGASGQGRTRLPGVRTAGPAAAAAAPAATPPPPGATPAASEPRASPAAAAGGGSSEPGGSESPEGLMNDLLAQMQAQGGGQELQEWLSQLQLEAAAGQEAGEAQRSASLTLSAGAASGEGPGGSGEQEEEGGDSASEGYTSGGTDAASSGWSSGGGEEDYPSD